MEKFGLDLTPVHEALYEDVDRVSVKGNEHRMIRVAFDLFHLQGDEKEDLWQVQADDDGEFLVRTYSLPDDENITTSDWAVKEDIKNASLTVIYKGVPIQRLAALEYNVTNPEDLFLLKKILFRKLATDKNFVSTFVGNLPEVKRNMLKEAGVFTGVVEIQKPVVEENQESNEMINDLAILELELMLKEASARLSSDIELPPELQFEDNLNSEEEPELSSFPEEDQEILKKILNTTE